MPNHAHPITDDKPAGVNDVYVHLPPYGQAAPIAETVLEPTVDDLDIRGGTLVVNYTLHPGEDDFLYQFPTPDDQGNDDDTLSLQTSDGSACDGAGAVCQPVPTLPTHDLTVEFGLTEMSASTSSSDLAPDLDAADIQGDDLAGNVESGTGEAEPEPDGVALGLDTFTILLEPAASDADFNVPLDEGQIDLGGTDSTVESDPIIDPLNLDDVPVLESLGYDLSLMLNSLTYFRDSIEGFTDGGQAVTTGSIYAGDTIGAEDIRGDGFDVGTDLADEEIDALTLIVIDDGGETIDSESQDFIILGDQDPDYDFGSGGENSVLIIEPIGGDTTTDPDRPDLHDMTVDGYDEPGLAGPDVLEDPDTDANITLYTSNFGATVEPEQSIYSWTDTSHITLVGTDSGSGSDPLDVAGATDLAPVPASVRGFGQSETSSQADLSSDAPDPTERTGNTGPSTPLDLGDILDPASSNDELSGLLEGLGGSAGSPPAGTGLTSLDDDGNDDALDGAANAVANLGVFIPFQINGELDPADLGARVDLFP